MKNYFFRPKVRPLGFYVSNNVNYNHFVWVTLVSVKEDIQERSVHPVKPPIFTKHNYIKYGEWIIILVGTCFLLALTI